MDIVFKIYAGIGLAYASIMIFRYDSVLAEIRLKKQPEYYSKTLDRIMLLVIFIICVVAWPYWFFYSPKKEIGE